MHTSSTTRAADPRPARTRAAIHAAVERLSAEEGTDFTVDAVARAAGVSRTSFYAHFPDLDALAVSMLVEAFREIGHDDVDARRSTGMSRRALARASSVRLVEHVASRRAFYRASLDWKLSSRVHEHVVEAYADRVLETVAADPDLLPTGVDARDAARFVAGGALAVLTAWLRIDDPIDPGALADRLVAVMPQWLTSPDRPHTSSPGHG